MSSGNILILNHNAFSDKLFNFNINFIKLFVRKTVCQKKYIEIHFVVNNKNVVKT